jgi:divalent metal cation (Fe/Co/Zn/Cd) transporter
MWLAIAVAVATIALKTTAWAVTGSVGLLSDAAESVVNLLAAATIGASAIDRLLYPAPLSDVGVGVAIAVVAR